jgi:hypothetical protein
VGRRCKLRWQWRLGFGVATLSSRAPIYSEEGLLLDVEVLYAALQALGIVNVGLHQEYSPRIVFIFSQWWKDLYHV